MNKRVYIIHCWEGDAENAWQPWLKKALENKEFKVTALNMPNTMKPTFESWLGYMKEEVKDPDEQTYFVGHSLGCITILRFLELLPEEQKVGGAVLVAGFGTDVKFEGYKNELASFFVEPINWDKIKNQAKHFIAIHSDNDKYVNLDQSILLKERLAAKTIIEHNMGHFSKSDKITDLPIALTSLLEIAND